MNESAARGPLGILSAMPEELAHLVDDEQVRLQRAGLTFWRGHIGPQEVILVESGMGKVNAALAAGLLLDRFECRALMFCGVAGGLDPKLGIGDVVIGVRNVQHDYGSIVGGALVTYQPGSPPFPQFGATHGYNMPPELNQRLERAAAGLTLPMLEAKGTGGAPRQPRLVFGTIVTGDTFVNCALTRERLATSFAAQAVEMEGAAVAQACERFGGVPFVNVRCLSDLAGAESHMKFDSFLAGASQIAAVVVRRLALVV